MTDVGGVRRRSTSSIGSDRTMTDVGGVRRRSTSSIGSDTTVTDVDKAGVSQEDEIYYSIAGESPIATSLEAFKELMEGEVVTGNTLVWMDGWDSWEPLEDCRDKLGLGEKPRYLADESLAPPPTPADATPAAATPAEPTPAEPTLAEMTPVDRQAREMEQWRLRNFHQPPEVGATPVATKTSKPAEPPPPPLPELFYPRDVAAGGTETVPLNVTKRSEDCTYYILVEVEGEKDIMAKLDIGLGMAHGGGKIGEGHRPVGVIAGNPDGCLPDSEARAVSIARARPKSAPLELVNRAVSGVGQLTGLGGKGEGLESSDCIRKALWRVEIADNIQGVNFINVILSNHLSWVTDKKCLITVIVISKKEGEGAVEGFGGPVMNGKGFTEKQVEEALENIRSLLPEEEPVE